MADDIDISVVIGFKDWGTNRLATAVDSISNAFGSLNGEVIVSDYGSSEFVEAKSLLTDRGAIYVRTETDGKWSRSRALNAGFAIAKGRVLVATDADMIFSPNTFEAIGGRILRDPSLSLVLQCRDLPEGFSDEELAAGPVDWDDLAKVSRLRPRWGMGGMMATSRRYFNLVRGLDERMEIYGGEDIDFANRLRQSGSRLEWVTDPSIRMYHMWHPPTRQTVSLTPEGRAAIALNSKIHTSDSTIVRNSLSWKHGPAENDPLISVVISTHNRAEYLEESINSVLNQTLQDFEIIIVDDGSEDETERVVSSFSDDRIRYFFQEQQGIAAARNFAASQSRGRYTAIHDDDDLMLPWRLESQISSITPGIHGSYGGWVDFDDVTGELSPNYGKELSLGTLLHSGKVYLHPTLMVETSIIRALGYDASLRSGSDYNLGMRMMRSGYKIIHSGRLHTLRRIHPGQITALDPTVQRTSAVLSAFVARTPMSTSERAALGNANKNVPNKEIAERASVSDAVLSYLPDHLVTRDLFVELSADAIRENLENVSSSVEYMVINRTQEGEIESAFAVRRRATLADMANLRCLGLRYECVASSAVEAESDSEASQDVRRSPAESFDENWLSHLLDALSSKAMGTAGNGHLLIVHLNESDSEGALRRSLEPTILRSLELHTSGTVRRLAVVSFSSFQGALSAIDEVGDDHEFERPLLVSLNTSRWRIGNELENEIKAGE